MHMYMHVHVCIKYTLVHSTLYTESMATKLTHSTAPQYLHGRGVHEVEREEVVDAHSFQREHSRSEVCPLYLRNCRG